MLYSATSWLLAGDTGVPVTGFPPNAVIGITVVVLILFVIMIFFTIQLSSYTWIMRIIYRNNKNWSGYNAATAICPTGCGTFQHATMEMAVNENDRSLSVNIDVLLARLRTLIADARKEAKRTVDVIQVRTCWEIGRHIVEFEQGGLPRAAYGKKLLSRLAESLTW